MKYRTHTNGELRIENAGDEVILSGWVQRTRNLGGMTFLDLRDRYGITQLVFDMETNADLCDKARQLGREFVIRAKGKVAERSSKNPQMPTGEIEIIVSDFDILSRSETPPFTLVEKTDGGEELRMKYRYLDLRRENVRKGLELRHKLAQLVRNYLSQHDFLEVETPVLIKSTPEGARDFVVPSRLHTGQFYALPQSPQIYKQLLMVSGFERYFQIVKCFRDEDFRADRQPEFTQIDCEMSFVERDQVLEMFEGLTKKLFKEVKNIELEGNFQRMSYADAMKFYGTDKPDLRFEMKIAEITEIVQNKGFKVFDSVEYVGAIAAPGAAGYSRKQLDKLTKFVQKPQIGAKGLVWVKYDDDGSFKSSVDKFYSPEELKKWADALKAQPGDLLLVLAGDRKQTLGALCELRLEMGTRLELRDNKRFVPLWVVDFPLFEWDDETQRYYAMHHPFTMPKQEDLALLDKNAGEARAEAYDLVINGVEIGGGSIRIHDTELQQRMFKYLGFSPEEARQQFGFLTDAFRYGAPPHGGIAFGFDRLAALFAGLDSIRDVIAFPKNNAGRDLMNDSPAPISEAQLEDLHLKVQGKKGA